MPVVPPIPDAVTLYWNVPPTPKPLVHPDPGEGGKHVSLRTAGAIERFAVAKTGRTGVVPRTATADKRITGINSRVFSFLSSAILFNMFSLTPFQRCVYGATHIRVSGRI